MAEQLRTLKDLGCAITTDNLRDEAIKWIKELEEIRKKFPKQVTKERNIQEWIKYFFNISETDLKEYPIRTYYKHGHIDDYGIGVKYTEAKCKIKRRDL